MRRHLFRHPFGLRRRAAGRAGKARRAVDAGAAAVEFALVSPLLFMLLFGIIDYGLFIADVLTVQQGVSDAAREATLSVGASAANWPGTTTCGAVATPVSGLTGTDDLTRVACGLGDTVQPIAGGVLTVKAEIVDPAGNPAVDWKVGNRLRVCAMTRHEAVLPFVPMPDGGVVTARTDMPIQPGGVALKLNPVAQDTPTPDVDWSWC